VQVGPHGQFGLLERVSQHLGDDSRLRYVGDVVPGLRGRRRGRLGLLRWS
jgi:hypothetical protein